MKGKISRRIAAILLIILIIFGIITYIRETGQRIQTHSASTLSSPESDTSSASDPEHFANQSQETISTSEDSSAREWSGPVQVPWNQA